MFYMLSFFRREKACGDLLDAGDIGTPRDDGDIGTPCDAVDIGTPVILVLP
jgi:hypothetical protein